MRNLSRSFCVVQLALLSLFYCGSSSAASAFVEGALITKVYHGIAQAHGPNGGAYVTINSAFPLPGGCMYAGNINASANWMLQFNAELPSFKSMFALAIAARMSGQTVRIDYDDGFGGGASCRITAIVVG